MSKTAQNLMDAFAGESQANRKYLAFAKQADKEGCKQAAKMFRAAAHAETIHALKHLSLAGKIGDTAANLKAAIDGETYEYTKMYPDMIADAETEGQKAAAVYMKMVNKVEEIHAKLYAEVAQNPSEDGENYYVCPICGFVHKGKFDGKCPVCGADGKTFEEIK